MTTQIAVRLPDDLVEHVDSLVSDGGGSRAAVVTRALTLYLQQLRGERDARILEETGDYEEFESLIAHQVIAD